MRREGLKVRHLYDGHLMIDNDKANGYRSRKERREAIYWKGSLMRETSWKKVRDDKRWCRRQDQQRMSRKKEGIIVFLVLTKEHHFQEFTLRSLSVHGTSKQAFHVTQKPALDQTLACVVLFRSSLKPFSECSCLPYDSWFITRRTYFEGHLHSLDWIWSKCITLHFMTLRSISHVCILFYMSKLLR